MVNAEAARAWQAEPPAGSCRHDMALCNNVRGSGALMAPTNRSERAFQGMEEHRFLLFGERSSVPYYISVEGCNVDVVVDYEDLNDLSEYMLVILDYSAFCGTDRGIVYEKQQEVFDKQMVYALENGTWFCFLHYDDEVPPETRVLDPTALAPQMRQEDVREFRRLQIGFRWLDRCSIRPLKGELQSECSLRRGEFQTYMARWGASKNHFLPYENGRFSDVIAELGDGSAVAFVLDQYNGKLIYLPCQRDLERPNTLSEQFATLVASLRTYITKTRTVLPDWANEPMFDDEKEVGKRKALLHQELAQYDQKLRVFYSAKQLLFQSEHGLEDALVEFLQERCGMSVEREERYREDFWLLDSEGNKAAICEVKSRAKGLKRADVYSAYAHRDGYELGDEYPAILFVNLNMNAASRRQKSQPVDTQHCKLARDNHILIVRVEDLLLAWDSLRQGATTPTELLTILTQNAGSLRFKGDGSWEIVP